MAATMNQPSSKVTITEETQQWASSILRLNEEGIQVFRLKRSAKENERGCDDDVKGYLRHSLSLFEEAAMQLANLCKSMSSAETPTTAQLLCQAFPDNGQQKLQDAIAEKKMKDENIASTASNVCFQAASHDYELADFISMRELFFCHAKSSMEVWAQTAATIVLHNLGLVTLHKAAVEGKLHSPSCYQDPQQQNAIQLHGLKPLKLCLDSCKQNTFSSSTEDLECSRTVIFKRMRQTIVSKVEASANYLLGLTLYQKASVGDNNDLSSSFKRRKLSQSNQGSKISPAPIASSQETECLRDQESSNQFFFLQKAMEYVLDGLGAMNDYQTCLMLTGAYFVGSQKQLQNKHVDTTSIPIGLLYVLGQLYYKLDMRRDAMKAFQKCSWFVKTRQQQLVIEQMSSSVATGPSKASSLSVSTTNKMKSQGQLPKTAALSKKKSPTTRNAPAA